MADRDGCPELAPPDQAGHHRRVCAWWAVGLGLLGALGLFCWLFLGPFLETRAALEECLKLPENSSLHSIAAESLRKIRGEAPAK